MKFVISKETLIGPLTMITGVVDRKQTLPIIGNLLLEIRNNQLSMVATNLEVELKSQQPLSIEALDVRTTIPARKLNDIVKSLPDEAIIECELKEDQLNMHTAKTDFSLTVLPPDDFPLMKDTAIQVPEVRFSLSEKGLRHAINKCAFSMALQDVRYYLNGMLFEIENNVLTLVTTDGHRLSLTRVDIQYQGEKKRAIVPRRGVYELLRILGDDDAKVDVAIQGNNIRAKTSRVEFQSKLIDGEYPNYTAAIPKDPEFHFDVVTGDFINAVERTGIILNEKPRGTKLMLEPGRLTAMTTNPLSEKSTESIDVEYLGKTAELGFNTDYLSETFQQVETERSRVSFSDPSSSLLVEELEGDRSSFVIMPMKV